ncbi:MAG: hypothetical protein ACR2QM_08075, partial [Longimicrobiales bacterium]
MTRSPDYGFTEPRIVTVELLVDLSAELVLLSPELFVLADSPWTTKAARTSRERSDFIKLREEFARPA